VQDGRDEPRPSCCSMQACTRLRAARASAGPCPRRGHDLDMAWAERRHGVRTRHTVRPDRHPYGQPLL